MRGTKNGSRLRAHRVLLVFGSATLGLLLSVLPAQAEVLTRVSGTGTGQVDIDGLLTFPDVTVTVDVVLSDGVNVVGIASGGVTVTVGDAPAVAVSPLFGQCCVDPSYGEFAGLGEDNLVYWVRIEDGIDGHTTDRLAVRRCTPANQLLLHNSTCANLQWSLLSAGEFLFTPAA